METILPSSPLRLPSRATPVGLVVTQHVDTSRAFALLNALRRRSVFYRCSPSEVVAAFKIVGEEIRAKCQTFAAQRPTQVDVCQLARRIKEQRDLVRQIHGRCPYRHVLRLMRQNRRLRNRLVQIAIGWALDASILIFR